MSQNMFAYKESLVALYEEGGVSALRDAKKEFLTYLVKVSDLEKLGDEMTSDLFGSEDRKLQGLAKLAKSAHKAAMKQVKARGVAKRKAEREARKAEKALQPKKPRGRPPNPEKVAAQNAEKEQRKQERLAASRLKQMKTAFGYMKRIQRDAKRVAAKEAAMLEKLDKVARKAHRAAMKELKANAVAERKAEREAKKAAKEAAPPAPKLKPGRPKKAVKAVESALVADDLVASLLAEVAAEQDE